MSSGQPVLSIDIGGTKILVALVDGTNVLDRVMIPTPRDAGGEAWCAAIADASAKWRGRFASAGAAVTGIIADGRWSAVNPETLPVPEGFPLRDTLSRHLEVPVLCVNDAQAAAWGEYRHGAGTGRDMAFITISTGVGGGLVLDGKLLGGHRGFAGHVGQLPVGCEIAENLCSGRWMARAAAGRAEDARAVFIAADRGLEWAQQIIARSVRGSADLVASLQWIADPEIVVIGGGIGMVPAYFSALQARLAKGPSRASLRLAQLGNDAGIIGVADLAASLDRIST